MELRHLRYFVTLAEELNFTRAAKRLNMAQPPLSQQIQQLERELGVLLFKRTNRRVELTYAGQVFQVEVRSALEQVERAVRAVRRADGRDCGHLTVGAGVMPIQSVLTKVVPLFRKEFASVHFRLRELVPQAQSHMLRDGSIDVGFVIPPFDQAGLSSELVLTDGIVAWLPNHHPLTKKHSLELSDLENERFVLPDRNWAPTYFDHLIMACREAGFSPNIVHTGNDFQTVITLIGAGLGIGLAAASTRTIPVEGVHSVPIHSAGIPVWMAWREDNKNPVAIGFVELVRSHARKFSHG